jgi:single-strand DNA-binding protein
MAGEVNVTIVGNLAADPELRYTQGGVAVTSLRVGSTPRTFNRQTSQWEDGETVWVRCTAWRDLAENIANSLQKGTRVIVTGRLKPASAYQAASGEARASIELEIEEIGPSLLRATASVTARAREAGAVAGGANAWGNSANSNPANPTPAAAADDTWATPGAFGGADDTPF